MWQAVFLKSELFSLLMPQSYHINGARQELFLGKRIPIDAKRSKHFIDCVHHRIDLVVMASA